MAVAGVAPVTGAVTPVIAPGLMTVFVARKTALRVTLVAEALVMVTVEAPATVKAPPTPV